VDVPHQFLPRGLPVQRIRDVRVRTALAALSRRRDVLPLPSPAENLRRDGDGRRAQLLGELRPHPRFLASGQHHHVVRHLVQDEQTLTGRFLACDMIDLT